MEQKSKQNIPQQEEKKLLRRQYFSSLQYEKETLMNNFYMDKCQKIIKNLLGNKKSLDFRKPINIKDNEEYPKVIKHPKNLNQVRTDFESNKFQYVEEFLDDIQLVFDNAKNYNIEQHDIFKQASEIEQIFHNLITQELKDLKIKIQPIMNYEKYKTLNLAMDEPLQFYEKNRFSINIRYLPQTYRDLVLNCIVRFSQKSVTVNDEGFTVDLDIINPKAFRKIAKLVEEQVFQPGKVIITPQSLDFSSKNKEKNSLNQSIISQQQSQSQVQEIDNKIPQQQMDINEIMDFQ